MSPLFYVVLGLLGLLASSLIGHMAQMDRAERYRRHGGDLPTITALPRRICIPTAWRRR